MKHNDRLELIIESALRSYGLKASPRPKLSLFLDFEVLKTWYTSVLHDEMKHKVEDVLAVWKDVKKDASGNAADYSVLLPWIPQRTHGRSGIFVTMIPEDVSEILMTYVTYAKLHKDTVASSFHSVINKFDTALVLSFNSSFLYLSELYQEAMNTKGWLYSKGEDDLMQHIEFYCSVANDASKVVKNKLLDRGKKFLDVKDLTEDQQSNAIDLESNIGLFTANLGKFWNILIRSP
jgi:hypothetical protein